MSLHPELSRRVSVRSLSGERAPASGAAAGPGAGSRGGRETESLVEAGAPECDAVARRLDVPAVRSLVCRFRLGEPDRAGRVVARGLLRAVLVRNCVATLEDFEATVSEAFTVRFVPDGTALDESLDPDADDDVPYDGGSIDLGEAAVEQLALALDPYPRRPGAELPPGIGAVDLPPAGGEDEAGGGGGTPDGENNEAARANPFAVLAARRGAPN